MKKKSAAANANINTNDVVEKIEFIESSENLTMSNEDTKSNSYSDSNVLFYSEEESKEIQEKDKKVLDSIQDSLTKIEQHKNNFQEKQKKYNLQLLLEFIRLGIKLVNYKKELGSRFFTVINQDVLNAKLVYSYIRLVMTNESQKEYDITVKSKKENPELIVLEERIVNLLEKDLSKMVNPSKGKLENMSTLSDDDFNDIINGNDTAYEQHMKDINTKKVVKKMGEEKPENMDENTFKIHLQEGIYETIRKLHDKSEKVAELSSEVLQLKLEIEKLNNENIVLKVKNDMTTDLLNSVIPTNGKLFQNPVVA